MFLSFRQNGGLCYIKSRRVGSVDAYKKRQGVSHIYNINIDTVGEILGKEAPYYGHKADGEGTYFAVCPACDNPVQLIGIFRNSPETGSKPYARHYPKDIVGLAKYDEAEYLDCPYSNKNWSTNTKRSPESKMGQNIIELLKEQFDRVIYILEQDLEIKISKETARKMLQEYLACEGWTYRAATMNNLPWKFAETGCARPLFGRWILVGGELERALRSKCPEVELVPTSNSRYVKVMCNDKQFVSLQYFLHKHHCRLEEEHLCESITMRVYNSDDAEHTVFEKEISINTEYFMNLISLPAERCKRNEGLLSIAKEEMT